MSGMKLKEELESLGNLLRAELSHDRISPDSVHASRLSSLLEEEKIRNDSLSAKLESLNTEIFEAGEFIDSLKDEVKKESDKVALLQSKLNESQKEYFKKSSHI